MDSPEKLKDALHRAQTRNRRDGPPGRLRCKTPGHVTSQAATGKAQVTPRKMRLRALVELWRRCYRVQLRLGWPGVAKWVSPGVSAAPRSTVLGPAIEFTFSAGDVVTAHCASVPGAVGLVLMAVPGALVVDGPHGLLDRTASLSPSPTNRDSRGNDDGPGGFAWYRSMLGRREHSAPTDAPTVQRPEGSQSRSSGITCRRSSKVWERRPVFRATPAIRRSPSASRSLRSPLKSAPLIRSLP